MVERGPNTETDFEAPVTGEGQPYVAPVENVAQKIEATPTSQTESAPAQQDKQPLRDYDLASIATGSEQPEIIDLQGIMQAHFEQSNSDEETPHAA